MGTLRFGVVPVANSHSAPLRFYRVLEDDGDQRVEVPRQRSAPGAVGQVPARRNQQDGERRRRDLQVQEVLRGRRQQQQHSRRSPRQDPRQEEARFQPQRVPGQRVRQTTPRGQHQLLDSIWREWESGEAAEAPAQSGCRVQAPPLVHRGGAHPPDVVCIDPVDDETLAYFPEFVRYLRHRETEWIHRKKDIVGSRMDVEANRALLMNWLLEVALPFRVSQETLYHTVGMIDATLAMRDVDNAHLQLVSVTALLIAAKLEEYHPPSIKDLLAITEDSYTFDDVVKMERKLLALHDFRGYNAEPMVFINRFVRAAFQDSNSVFRNVCLLFYDCLIPTIGFSAIRVSEKAAAAVFAARIMLHDIDEIDFEMWPPTLAYYTGYEEKDVSTLALLMIDQLSKCMRQAVCAGGKEKGVLRKFRSRSTHDAVVRLPQLSLESIEEKMKDLSAAARREFY